MPADKKRTRKIGAWMPTLFGIDPSSPMGIISNAYILGAFALSVSITALSYMAGEFFQMPTLKGFSKVELGELFVTALILLLAIILVTPGGAFDMIARGFAMPDSLGDFNGKVAPNMTCSEWLDGHGDYDPASGSFSKGNLAYAQAHYFLGCAMTMSTLVKSPTAGEAITLYNNLNGVPDANREFFGRGIMMPRILSGYVHLMWVEALLGFVSTVDFGFGYPLGQPFMWLNVGGFTPLIGLNLVSEANIFVVDAIAAAWSGFAAQKMLLQFVETSVITYFLPLGLFLRAIPFSRKTGSTILAIVFAAYFVYPTTVLVSQRIYYALSDPQGPPGNTLYGVGHACNLNSECKSGLCRGDICISPLTDFNEYGSVFQICKENTDPQTLMDNWKLSVEKQKPRLTQLAELSAQYYGSSGQQSTRQFWGIVEAAQMNRLDSGRDEFGNPMEDFMFKIVMGSPQLIANGFFSLFEATMVDTSKYILLTMLFIVIEVVITLTLVKDFAILIGGEPRIFGLSKIV
jgi:hypothetical protein